MNDFGRQNVELSDYSLSLVIPLHNEAQGIKETLRALQALLKELCENYEIIVVDDGSTDNTWEVCESMAESDLRIKLIRFTRNFGKEAAILAGLKPGERMGMKWSMASRQCGRRNLFFTRFLPGGFMV
jgi:cellulose synthase/poly-beta-1,6-N-acetylglucosamine synthase-like glycosyltransferase